MGFRLVDFWLKSNMKNGLFEGLNGVKSCDVEFARCSSIQTINKWYLLDDWHGKHSDVHEVGDDSNDTERKRERVSERTNFRSFVIKFSSNRIAMSSNYGFLFDLKKN